MRFNPRASINASRMRTGGGSGSGLGGLGSGGLRLPGGRLGGGGIGTIIIAAIVIFVMSKVVGGGSGGGLGNIVSSAFGGSSTGLSGQAFDYSTCQTGDDANNHPECAMVAVENSLNDYWSTQPQVQDVWHAEKAVTVFNGSVTTDGCGSATTDAGPFYCPVDETIYLDTGFYDTVGKQLGLDATTFVRAYIIGHEYGHHIQNLLGTMDKVKTQQGADSDSVRLELQADCYSGMWAAAATSESDGIIESITDQDVNEGIAAAKTVGDDYIQNTMQGATDSSSYTHGTSAQRIAWFEAGLHANDDITHCDTFSSSDLDTPGT